MDAIIPEGRGRADLSERNYYYHFKHNKEKKHHYQKIRADVEVNIARWQLILPGSDKKGPRGLFRRAFRRIIILLHLEDLRIEYEDFKKWHQERREAAGNVVIVADMEDQGDDPKWKGKMTLTVRPEDYHQYMDTDTWFQFPSQDNIRWYWVKNEEAFWELYGYKDGRWGPSNFNAPCMPFRRVHGNCLRNVRMGTELWCDCRLAEDFPQH